MRCDAAKSYAHLAYLNVERFAWRVHRDGQKLTRWHWCWYCLRLVRQQYFKPASPDSVEFAQPFTPNTKIVLTTCPTPLQTKAFNLLDLNPACTQ